MTPARRRALRKAQLVSARKRKAKAIAKGVGSAAVNIGGLFVAARITSYIVKPSKVKNDYNSVKSLFLNSNKNQKPAINKILKTARMTWIP